MSGAKPPSESGDETVRIDRSRSVERMRYTCPNGHISWDRTNNHIWCPTCRQSGEHGADVDAEHYHIIDQTTRERIHWDDVEIVE